jgi:hypothetical protein
VEKQIEKMKKDIHTVLLHNCKYDFCEGVLVGFNEEGIARELYDEGYRKQSEGEWKKVYQNKIATVYECSCCKHLTFGTSDYCICGAKMKGGAE